MDSDVIFPALKVKMSGGPHGRDDDEEFPRPLTVTAQHGQPNRNYESCVLIFRIQEDPVEEAVVLVGCLHLGYGGVLNARQVSRHLQAVEQLAYLVYEVCDANLSGVRCHFDLTYSQ